MPSLFFTCPNTRQQADTGILTDAESLRDTWSMTLNVHCPHCGQMHAVSMREAYIDQIRIDQTCIHQNNADQI
jgi:hypothetical protein